MSYKVFFIVLLLFSCSKKKEHYKEIKIIGHAGTGLNMISSVHHDNSLEAIEQALATEGCDGVEIDVQLSKDGNLWLYHDTKLESESDGEGCIPNLTSSYLTSVQYVTIHKESLVSLNDIDLKLFHEKVLFFDLRHFNSCDNTFIPAQTVVDRLVALGIDPTLTEVYCNVGYDQWIQPLKTAGFKVIFQIYNYEESKSVIQNFPQVDGFIIRNNDVSKEEVSAIKDTGKKVFIFELRSPKGIKKAMHKFPDGVLTDDLKSTIIEKY